MEPYVLLFREFFPLGSPPELVKQQKLLGRRIKKELSVEQNARKSTNYSIVILSYIRIRQGEFMRGVTQVHYYRSCCLWTLKVFPSSTTRLYDDKTSSHALSSYDCKPLRKSLWTLFYIILIAF